MEEKVLLELAVKELLGEAKRAAVRHSEVGPSGWQPCPLPKTNKRFLVNTLKQTMSANKIKNRKNGKKGVCAKTIERKLLKINDNEKIRRNSDNFIYKTPEKIKKDTKPLEHSSTEKCVNNFANKTKR